MELDKLIDEIFRDVKKYVPLNQHQEDAVRKEINSRKKRITNLFMSEPEIARELVFFIVIGFLHLEYTLRHVLRPRIRMEGT